MTIAAQYAKAISALIEESPKEGKKFLSNLHSVLESRGHTKLLPQILRELEKLTESNERIAQAKAVTPERERTRVLFELYKKLIAQ